MNRHIIPAILLIVIGGYFLLNNFFHLKLDWRIILYIMGVFWGLTHINQYIQDKKPGTLVWGIGILGTSLWLISINLFWTFISGNIMVAGIVTVLVIALGISVVLSGKIFALSATIPPLAFIFLLLNNHYYWISDLYLTSWRDAALGTVLLSLGIYYMTSSERFTINKNVDETKNNDFL